MTQCKEKILILNFHKNLHMSSFGQTISKMSEIINKIADFEDKSLLIVDDDNPFRDRLARSMEKKGFKVTQAESVKFGIQKGRENKPEFVVVDLRMGDDNGLGDVREIR